MESHASLLSLSAAPTNVSVMGPLLYSAVTKLVAQPRPGRTVMGFGRSQVVEQGLVAVAEYGGASMFAMSDPGSPAGNWQFVFDLGLHEPDSTGVNTRARIAMHHGWVVSGYKDVSYLFAPVANATASIHNAAWRQIASFPIGDEVSICAPGENAPLPDGAWGPGPLHDGIGPPTLQASLVVLASDSTNEVARVFAPAIASQPRGNWTTVTTLSQAMVPESVVSGWGAAVALHVNTSGVAVAFIGSPNDNTLDTSMGAVYQFVAANASDANSWVFVAKFSGSTVENRMFFGSALALSSCGTLLAAGGPGQFFGVVGVFEPASSGDWGAPVEWVERVSLRHGNTGTSFGRAIGISSTSQCVTVVAGAQNDDTVETNGGAVFAFASSSRDLADTSTAWRATKIVDPDATSSFQLGMSVSISGTTVMAGAASRVEVFVLSLGLDAVATNIQPTSGSHSFGSVTAIDPDSGCPSNPITACARVVVGAPDVGRAYIMSGDPRDPSHWAAAVELVAKDSTSASSDKFGRDVAISQGVVLVGGGFRSGVCSQGCGYVFVCSDTGGGALSCPRVAVLAPTFDVPSAGPNAEAVALSWPARLAALSCDDKVCLYHATDASGSAWTEAAVLRPPHLEPPGYYYSFGTSLALGFTPGDDGSPPTPVVATNGRPVVNGATGWVHVYTPVTPGNLTSWHLTQMLGATATSSTSDFAKIVSAAPDASLLGGTGASGEAIRLFRRTPSAVKWDFEAALLPLSSVQSATSKYASASKFGSSLSIGSGGLTVAVGASGDASSGSGNGAAYVFKATSNRTASVAYTWNRVVRMTPRSFLNAGLGASASGHSVAVGAGFVVAGGSKRGLAYVLPLVSFAGDIRDMPLPLALRAAGCIGDDQLLTKDVCPPLLLGAGRRTSYAQPTPEQLFDVGYQHLKLLSQRPLGLVGHVPQGQCWTQPPVRFQVQSFNLRDVPWYASQLRFQPAAALATSWVDGGLLQIMPSDPSVSVALRRCYLEGGVGRRGGAVFVANAGLELTDTTFSGGAAMQGGAVAVAQDATLAMTGCMISGAVASQHGGAVSATLATVMIGSSLFGNNTAGARGGGVYAGFGSDVGVTDTTFAYCTAAQGGAVGTEASTVSLNSVAMLWNFASSTGGGLYVDTTSTMTGRSINVTRNTAASGGGVSVTGGVCTLRDSTFDGNTATQHGGGGVWCQSSGQLSLTGATIENNAAQLRGGGLGADHCVTNLTRCTVSANTVVTVANEGVDEGGGGVFASAALDADDTAVAFVLGSATVLRANSALRGAGSLFNTVALGGEVCGKTALTCSGLPNAAFDVSRTAIVEDVTLWLSFPPLLPTGFSGPLRSMAAQAVAFPYNVSAESGMTLPSVRLSLLDVYGHPALPLEGTQAFASIHNTSSAIAVGSASLLGVLVATFNGMFADFASLGLLAVPGSTVWLSLSTNQPDVAAALLAVQVAECPPGTQLGLRNVSCTACSVGWHSPGGAAPGLCQPCPAGYYAVDAGRGGCVPCGSTSVYCPAGSGAPVPVSPGYYSTPTDSPAALRTGQQQCALASGQYCVGGTGTAVDCGSAAVWCGVGVSSPTPVRAGYYSEPEGEDPARRSSEAECPSGYYCTGGVKHACPAGKYGSSAGLSSLSDCGACAAGHFCPEASVSSTAIVCGSPAVFCPAGSTKPTPAPTGSYTTGGSGASTRIEALPCERGSWCDGGLISPCGPGLYGASVGLSDPACSGLCQAGYVCEEGSVKAQEAECGAKFGARVYCPEGSSSPLLVGDGNYTLGGSSTTRTEQHVCEPGHYCDSGERQLCPAGRFGNTSALQTSDCSGYCVAGYYCAAGSTSSNGTECGDTSVYCPAESGAPVPVSSGYYSTPTDSPAALRTGQQICEAGRYCSAGTGTAVDCGSAAVWCGIGATSPTLVTMGYYSEPEGGDPARRTSEQQCEPGFYCSGGVRRPCGAGRFGDVPGLSTISCAGPCSAGHYCAAGATSSVASVCPAGWYCLEGSASPTGVCEPGHFCPVGSTMPRAKPCGSVQQFCPAGATNPLVVGVGNMSVGVTPETRRAQVPCPLGFYCTGGVSTPCPAGRFGAEPGLSSSDCSGACRAGWFCLAQSTTATAVPCGSNSVYCPAAADTPLTVPAGMQSVGGDAATRNGTLPCPAGTFAEAGWGVCSPCGPGEIAGAGSDKCEVCPDNTYAAEGHAECLPCVSKGATCQEGILTPMSGFWSPALVLSGTGQPSINLSAVAEGVVFYECPPGACVLDERSRITCAPHRTGPLCALCQGDYVLAGDQCESCGSTGANVVLLVLCTSVLLVGVVFVIRKATAHLGTRTSSKGSATKNENLVLALFKIITNYLQVVSQLGGFEVPWGSMVSTLFSLSSSSSSAPVSASFLQCTLRLSPYSRFLVVAAAPVVGAIGLLAIPIYHRLVGGVRNSWMVWRTAVLVLCFLLYTQVSTESLRLLNCSEEVDGVSYLKADYNINCASPKRRAFAVAASVTLAVFSLGLPAMSACILWRAQRGASSPSGEGVESLAFLTNGFKPQYRYWECIQMLRKFLIVAVAVLWSGAIDGLQLALGLGCVLVFLGLQATANPFANKTQDSLELAAHVATAFSLYGGWVLTMELSDTMSQAVQWAIISVTSAFLLVWLTLVVKESNRVLKRIRKKAGKRFSRRSSHNRQPVHRASVSDWLSNPMNEGGEDVPRETRRPAALVQLQRFTAQNAGSSKRAAADGVAPVLKAGSRPAGATDR